MHQEACVGVTPIVAPDGDLCPVVTLVAIDVSSANGLEGEVLDPILRRQLPQVVPYRRSETLLVVAATNHTGVSVLARRIQNQLARSPEFDHTQVGVRLFTTLVKTSPDVEDLGKLDIAPIARRISMWINELRKRLSDGEETDTDC